MLVTSGDDGAGIHEDIDVTMNNITIANILNSGSVWGVLVGAGMNSAVQSGPGVVTSTVSNVTIDNLESTSSLAAGLSSVIYSNATTSTNNSFQNVTINNLRGVDPGFGVTSAGVTIQGAGFVDDITLDNNLDLTNAVITNTDDNCLEIGQSAMFGTNATDDLSLVSNGGNLTDDDSCSSYFTDPTDQNNVSGLGASLSALADNGGYVPTMALLENSPAVDAGVTVAGLSTDARGVSRPLGNAYDSGAYESPFTTITAEEGSSAESLADTGQGITSFWALAALLILAGSITAVWRLKQKD